MGRARRHRRRALRRTWCHRHRGDDRGIVETGGVPIFEDSENPDSAAALHRALSARIQVGGTIPEGQARQHLIRMGRVEPEVERHEMDAAGTYPGNRGARVLAAILHDGLDTS